MAAEIEIRKQQVWRYRDEREDRQVVIDEVELSCFLLVHNEATGRRSRIRAEVLRRYYRLVAGGESSGS